MKIFLTLVFIIVLLALGSLALAYHSMPSQQLDHETALVNQAQGDGSLMYFGIAMLLLMLDAALLVIGFFMWLSGFLN